MPTKHQNEDGMTKEELEYQMLYGGIPNTQEEILDYIEEHFRINPKRLQEMIDQVKAIQWKNYYLV